MGNWSQRTQETMPKASTPSWRSTLQATRASTGGGSVSKYIERARKVFRELAEVMTRIFYDSNMPTETHYRTCDGLLNLQRSSESVSRVGVVVLTRI